MIRIWVISILLLACTTAEAQKTKNAIVGAEQLNELLPLLKNKRVGLVVNNTSLVKKTHVADTLIKRGVQVTRIFGPEHGFRGDAADGEHVKDTIDTKTGVLVVSLYGKNRKPTPEQMAAIDIMIFDIQDVGARFIRTSAPCMKSWKCVPTTKRK
jgi:Uncharacterized protein conserved in bacteria